MSVQGLLIPNVTLPFYSLSVCLSEQVYLLKKSFLHVVGKVV
jgi:hypothetical protein